MSSMQRRRLGLSRDTDEAPWIARPAEVLLYHNGYASKKLYNWIIGVYAMAPFLQVTESPRAHS